MAPKAVAILSPGDMGEGVGASIRDQGMEVLTVLAGRGAETRMRAARAGFREAAGLEELVAEAGLVLSIMPPGEAEEAAAGVAAAMRAAGRAPPYADMNAVSPMTSRRIGELVSAAGAAYIDGGIVGLSPAKSAKPTRLYVSGPAAGLMDALDGGNKRVVQLGDEIGRASAVKMIYASVTKGTDTLLTAACTAAEALGIREVLEAEWADSQPEALARMARRMPALPADAGRWIAEMEEIAATYAATGMTPGFHEGAAFVYRLLAASPFAAETRETMDRSRTMQESAAVYAALLAARKAAE